MQRQIESLSIVELEQVSGGHHPPFTVPPDGNPRLDDSPRIPPSQPEPAYPGRAPLIHY